MTEREKMIMEFSMRLKCKMKERNITQEELANRIGVARGSINRYINNKLIPDGLTLRKISKALNCSIDDFFDEEY